MASKTFNQRFQKAFDAGMSDISFFVRPDVAVTEPLNLDVRSVHRKPIT